MDCFLAFRLEDNKSRHHMVAPSREQVQHTAAIGLIVWFAQDLSLNLNNRVSG
jgi:hypothetical protein